MSGLAAPDTGEWFGWDDEGAWVGTGSTLAGAVVPVIMRRRWKSRKRGQTVV